MSRSQTKRLYNSLTILGIGVVLALIFTFLLPFSNLNSWLSDRLFISEKPDSRIIIAGIDDKTLELYGKLSDWPRSLHARAVDNLAKDQAKVIGFDVLFIDSSLNDNELSDSISKAGNVVLPIIGLDSAQYKNNFVQFNNMAFPGSSFSNYCKTAGHINITPDSDGVIRHFPLVISDGGSKLLPSFTLATLASFFEVRLPINYGLKDKMLNFAGLNIPMEDYCNLRINFNAENKQRPYISYMDIIKGNYDPLTVKNKIVLVGITASGGVDSWSVPGSIDKTSGIYIHASAIETILTGQFLIPVGRVATLIIMLLFAILAAIVLPRIKLVFGGFFIAGLMILYFISSSILFESGYVPDILYPMLILPIAYISNVVGHTIIAQSEKNLVKNLFGRYVSPQVAKEIMVMADENRLNLGGEQREVTILFADIRHFTEISGNMKPADVVNMLNSYFSIIIDQVLKNGGTINKFAGDNIMAFWNAPQEQPMHALFAVRAAYEAQKEINKHEANRYSEQNIQFGIGINTGRVLAGNIGSLGRMEYTVIGDPVNIAARICESATGDAIWIGEQTFNAVKDRVKVKHLEPQSFKGKTEKQIVYEVTNCS